MSVSQGAWVQARLGAENEDAYCTGAKNWDLVVFFLRSSFLSVCSLYVSFFRSFLS